MRAVLPLLPLLFACSPYAATVHAARPLEAGVLTLVAEGQGVKASEYDARRVTVSARDLRGPSSEELAQYARKDAADRAGAAPIGPVVAVPREPPTRELSIDVLLSEDGRSLAMRFAPQVCATHFALGLSGFPIGGGCIRVEPNALDLSWFEAQQRRIAAKLR